jgi:hypothetical protein
MTCSNGLSQWTETVSRHLPHLSRPQARVLALWSFGMILAQSGGITQISALLSLLLGSSEASLRQRLREWLYGAADKKGAQRQEVKVEDCFAPLLRWVLASWPAGERRLALAIDATTLGQRFTVLSVSVVLRSCAIPVAWKVLIYNEKGSWRPHWEGLLEALRGSVPADWEVIVMADRGLDAPWLFQKIVALGWHPRLAHQPGGESAAGCPPAVCVDRAVAAGGWAAVEWDGGVFCPEEESSAVYLSLVPGKGV